MRTTLILSLITVWRVSTAGAIEIETVAVGNANNPVDRTVMIIDGTTNYGSVPYNYRISTYELTNAQYVEFLNAVAATDTHALYNAKMGSNPRGGIIRSGESGSYTYSLRPNMANKPVNWIEPRDAFRFANWMHNGQPTGAQDHSTTEDGAYFMDHAFLAPETIERKEGAKWFLPNEDEWVKAAYYDPRTEASGGPPGDDHYWTFATQSDTNPILTQANNVGEVTNPGPNVANYLNAVTWNGAVGNVVSVGGSGPASTSFYGAYDLMGNVWEWTESVVKVVDSRANFGVRGGCYDDVVGMLKSHLRGFGRDSIDDVYSGTHGLRLATVFSPVDLDGNGDVQSMDIDLLSDMVAARTLNTAYDLDGSGMVDEDDRSYWVHQLANTSFGDANLDGIFNGDDLVAAFQAQKYRTVDMATWAEGDFTGDMLFNSDDLVLAFQDDGYVIPGGVLAAVPEPASFILLMTGLIGLMIRRRHSDR